MREAKKEKLALFGGPPVLKGVLPPIHNIDAKEIKEVVKVLKSGPLSGFIASFDDGFYGGRYVKKIERMFEKKFKVKYAVSFNSATTALHGALVALEIGPGDEVIVTPYSMSATATAILMNGAIPIFADINPQTFCLDPKSIEKNITKKTKAIMVVNLFGQSADYDAIKKIAKKNNLKIIEDNAQAPGAKYNGIYTGTIGDIGVFSFNIHKTIQAGEGGMLVTNNRKYALRASLARNHGEVVVDQMKDQDVGPIIGSNYRMPEVIAAIVSVQIPKLDKLNKERIKLADYLRLKLSKISGMMPPFIDPKSTHVYYRFAIKIDEKKLGISRDKLVLAMKAEGFNMSLGYVKPIYLLPAFQNQKIFNDTDFPFDYRENSKNKYNYKQINCPVVESLYHKELTLTDVCQYPYTKRHVDLFVKAINKVIDNKELLK